MKFQRAIDFKRQEQKREAEAKPNFLFSLFYGGGEYYEEYQDRTGENERSDQSHQSEEMEKLQFFQNVGYDYQSHAKIPEKTLILGLSFALRNASVTLKDRADLICTILLSDFVFATKVRQVGLSIDTSLSSVDFLDHSTKDTQWKNLIIPLKEDDPKEGKNETSEYFSLFFEAYPPISFFTHVLHLRMLPIQIIYNQGLVYKMLSFFKFAVSGISSSTVKQAGTQAKKIVDETTSQFAKDIEEKKLDLDIKIKVQNLFLQPCFCSKFLIPKISSKGAKNSHPRKTTRQAISCS